MKVNGSNWVEGIRFVQVSQTHDIPADTMLLHHGVVPNNQTWRMLRLTLRWSAEQQSWWGTCDTFGLGSISGFCMAGEGVAIAGARATEASGSLDALGAVYELGARFRDRPRVKDTSVAKRP